VCSKMALIGCPETSVRNDHYLPRNSPEERSSLLLRGGTVDRVQRNAIRQFKDKLLWTGKRRLLFCDVTLTCPCVG
jgi:hypothetical protein